jgi:hypothetical protein
LLKFILTCWQFFSVSSYGEYAQQHAENFNIYLFENLTLMRIFRPKAEEMLEGWRRQEE